MYRIGIIGDRELFESQKSNYDGLVIGSNFASFYRNSVPSLLRRIGKPFFFDPITYCFARDIENIKRGDDLRKSYQKLVDWYGGEIRKILDKRQLIPKDFFENKNWRTDRITKFVSNTLSMQREILKPQTSVQQSLLKYAKLAEEKEIPEEKLAPILFVAPYFYFDSTDDPWYNISIKLSQEARKQEKSKLYVPLCFSKELLLDEYSLSKIVSDYPGFDGYLVWISNLNDDEDPENYLTGLVAFLRLLDKSKKPILFLYGGFFSFLISKVIQTIEGYSRGICYGESKDADAVMAKGGGAPRRYYMDKVFSKLTEAIARTFYSDNPDELCRCSICTAIWNDIKNKSKEQRVTIFFDGLDYNLCRKHFMESHFKQIDNFSKIPLKDIIDLLKKYLNDTNKQNVGIYGIPNSHLSRWITVLSHVMKL